jgi:hypothetical protein
LLAKDQISRYLDGPSCPRQARSIESRPTRIPPPRRPTYHRMRMTYCLGDSGGRIQVAKSRENCGLLLPHPDFTQELPRKLPPTRAKEPQTTSRKTREFTTCCLWRFGPGADLKRAHNPYLKALRLARCSFEIGRVTGATRRRRGSAVHHARPRTDPRGWARVGLRAERRHRLRPHQAVSSEPYLRRHGRHDGDVGGCRNQRSSFRELMGYPRLSPVDETAAALGSR